VAKYYRIGAAAMAWFALVLQYYLTITKPGAPFLEATVRYFSFFTILTNILVALALTLPWLAPQSRAGQFFDRPSVRTAILAYIIIVAVIYHYLLAKLWNPQGWELVADTIEHVVTPALYVIDWVLFVPKGTVRWKSAFIWLLFPLAYAVYFPDPRRGDRVLSLSLHQCEQSRVRQGAHQHGSAGPRVPRARRCPDRHRSPHGPRQRASCRRGNLTWATARAVNRLV
jgi:hypothetical protein